MSFWTALNAGANSFQQGVNWSHQNVQRMHALRDMADERTQRNTINDLERERALLASGQPQQQVPGAPQAPEPGAPQPVAQPAAAPAEGATTTVGDAAQPPAPEEPVDRALAASRAEFVTPTATGGQGPNLDAYRRVVTGTGLPAGDTTVQGIRIASGNAQGPLSRGDVNAYLDRARQMFAERGIGHLYEAWQARTMQSLQSSAQRSLAFAAVAAEGGNMQAAAQWLQRAYGYVPDGANGQVTVNQDGTLTATRIGADGRPVGSPTTLTPQQIREMALTMADPGAMETLLIQRRQIAEVERANRAREALTAQAISARGAGQRGGPTPPSLSDQDIALRHADRFLDQALSEFPAQRGGTAPNRDAVTAGAASLILGGADPYSATRFAAAQAAGAPGLQYRWHQTPNGPVPIGALPGGQPMLLTGPTAAIAAYILGPPPTGYAEQPRATGVRRNQTPPAPVQRPAPTE